jgi:hypothetical protein
VASVPFFISNLLMITVIGLPGSEWLEFLTMFLSLLMMLVFAFQLVSRCCFLLCLKHSQGLFLAIQEVS